MMRSEITTCRGCGAESLLPVLDLGRQPPSNAFLRVRDGLEQSYPLAVATCPTCHLLQLTYHVDPEKLFPPDYIYRSSGSQALVDAARAYCAMIWDRLWLNQESVIIEVGSNDGYLLKNFVGRCRTLGVEPAMNVADEAKRSYGISSNVQTFQKAKLPRADLLIANNVMAHTPDLRGFVAAIARTLKPTGTATIEFTNTLELLKGGYWDSIYHEHYSYLSLRALEPLLNEHGLCVYDVEKLSVQGASLRLYVTPVERAITLAKRSRVAVLHQEELELTDPKLYTRFALDARKCIEKFQCFAADKPPLAAYGAAAKGNTFLNSCGGVRISMVGDTTPGKIGMFLPGSRIPVVSETVLLASKPEHILLLAWNWRDEAVGRLRALGYTGKFVIAMPKMEVF